MQSVPKKEGQFSYTSTPTKPSWEREWRRKGEPQAVGSHRAVALDGVMSSTTTQTQPRGLRSLTSPGGEGARSYLVVPADSKFPISIGCWQVLVPEPARTNT